MRFFVTLAFTILSSIQLFSQGINFFQGTWQETLEEAKKQDKIIFVDAYATWCGPCHRMSKYVFTQEKVGDYYNKHFVNVKLDMESAEGLKFRKKHSVSAYPTFFFIDHRDEEVHMVRGAQPAEDFIRLGERVLKEMDYSMVFEEEYNHGNRDSLLVFEYVKALNKAGKPSLKIANEYLRNEKDLNTDFNLRFILEATVYADSRIFDLLIKYQKEIAMLAGYQTVKDKIKFACTNTVQKAVDFQNLLLLEEAKAKMQKYDPPDAEGFVYESNMKYFKSTSDHKNYIKACKYYAREVVGGNAKDLHILAEEIDRNFDYDEKCMKLAEKFAKEAAEKSGLYNYYLTYAAILVKNGKKDEALKVANKSLKLAKKSGQSAEVAVRQFIKKIEGQRG